MSIEWVNPLDSDKKDRIRNLWYKYTIGLHETIGRNLNLLWLAGDNLIDATNVAPVCDHIYVPEHYYYPLKAKQESWQHLPSAMKRIIHVSQREEHLIDLLVREYDVINYDACGHMHKTMVDTIKRMFESDSIATNGLFFLTVAQWGRVGKDGKAIRIAVTMAEQIQLVNTIASINGWNIESVPEFPDKYKSNGNKNMYSYGWKCTKV